MASLCDMLLPIACVRLICCALGVVWLACAEELVNTTCASDDEYHTVARDEQGWLPIHHAAKAGNVTFLKVWKELMAESPEWKQAECCEAKGQLHANTADMKTAVHIAIESRQLEFLQWFFMMNDWMYSHQDEGPCKKWSTKIIPYTQKDKNGKTMITLALDSLLSPGEQEPSKFGVEAMGFLLRAAATDYALKNITTYVEKNMPWSAAFAEWYLNETKKIKRDISERLTSDGFGNKSMVLPFAKQISADPPMYEVNNTLSHEICAEIISDAKYMMRPSHVGGQNPVERSKIHEFISRFDEDNNTVLNKTELRKAMLGLLIRESGSFSDKADGLQVNCKTVAKILQIDIDGDGEVNLTSEKFNASEKDMPSFEDTLKRIITQLSGRKVRTNSVFFMPRWLKSGRVAVQQLQKVLQLPDWMVESSQNLQVAHYQPGNHYGPHLDGMGRIITVFNYLNDVDEGGETVFPMAHVPITRQSLSNISLTKECSASYNCCDPRCRAVNSSVCMAELHAATGPNATRGKMTVQELRKCLLENGTATWNLDEPGVRIKPRKGNTVVWWNFDRDTHGHTLESHESYHCGCDVTRGEKWVANLWLTDYDFFGKVKKYMHQVKVLRRAGRRFNFSSLANYADPSFELYIEAGNNATQRYRSLGKSLQLDMLGLRGRNPPTFYQQCPSLNHIEGTAEDLLTGLAFWIPDIHKRSALDLTYRKWYWTGTEEEVVLQTFAG